jgi:hypothetical protein
MSFTRLTQVPQLGVLIGDFSLKTQKVFTTSFSKFCFPAVDFSAYSTQVFAAESPDVLSAGCHIAAVSNDLIWLGNLANIWGHHTNGISLRR